MDAKVPNYAGWQSDVIVDLIKRYGFPYITLNPGASFRGLPTRSSITATTSRR
jgi:acetolactate synthase-1/2/3 large subunit